MINYKPNPVKRWTGAAMRNALAERRQAGTSIRSLSKKKWYP